MWELNALSPLLAVVVLASSAGCSLVIGNETLTVADASPAAEAAPPADAGMDTISDPPDVAPVDAAPDTGAIDACNVQACNAAKTTCNMACDTTAGTCNSTCGKGHDGKDCHDLCAQQQQQCHTDCVNTCDTCVSGCGAPCGP